MITEEKIKADISVLMNLTNLKEVDLDNTNVSFSDCSALKEALPDAEVSCK